jgi:uncharacterized protein YegP (UPF0339 family)
MSRRESRPGRPTDLPHGAASPQVGGVRGAYAGVSTCFEAAEVQVAGKFELYTDKRGKYRFRLKAGNGQIVAVGEAYENKASALNGIESVRKSAADAVVEDQTG